MQRRSFLELGMSGLLVPRLLPTPTRRSAPSAFPRQDEVLVREMVTVSHGNVARVKELLAAKPALAKAAIDWGYGDWESAIDAASHVGNRAIAELLLAHGARPTLFSAAMLGQLAVVKAAIEATPGVQRTLGPHSISLLRHAQAGGEAAQAVRAYLEQLGDADPPLPNVALDAAGRARYEGRYRFGPGEDEQLVVTTRGESLFIARVGQPNRGLRHLGSGAFAPAGAEAVRIQFRAEGDSIVAVAVFDPDLVVEATRL